MIAKARIAKIESKLTPQQVVLNWLAETLRQHDSYHVWFEQVLGQPSGEFPLNKVTKTLREAARAAMTGQGRHAAVEPDDAVQEAHFLVKLFLRACEMLLEQVRRYDASLSICVLKMRLCGFRAMLDMDVREAIKVLQGDAKPVAAPRGDIDRLSRRLEAYILDPLPGSSKARRQKKRAAGELDDDAAHETTGSWFRMRISIDELRADIVDFLVKVRLTREMIQAISRTYFAGQPILFHKDSKRLERLVGAAEGLATMHNIMLWTYDFRPKGGDSPGGRPRAFEPPPDSLIDQEAVKEQVMANVARNVAYEVRLAKAETLIGLGESEQGHRLIREAFRKHFGTGAS
jgi:hypothetical protein